MPGLSMKAGNISLERRHKGDLAGADCLYAVSGPVVVHAYRVFRLVGDLVQMVDGGHPER